MIPAGREVSIEREIFPELQAQGRLRAHISSSYWRDIGPPRSYLAASHDVLSGAVGTREGLEFLDVDQDRKSTRLNSSHANISHAVFCLKTKLHPLAVIMFGIAFVVDEEK